ncbi:DPP IV N-terminal domain-containing protein [Flavobacterium granuli]|uniref:Dipeptidyl-peptidase-4 n=1 Tax=Flavobacterium granuli TaxID=280093 RepID=A0ABU1S014_9FLAO|nr:DPP IV N-terminal domain-containing protein [Flavobacterium granuli]MDR6844363.1 dipeptidyl-peptidase-4 [Flavobacterium granuli]
MKSSRFTFKDKTFLKTLFVSVWTLLISLNSYSQKWSRDGNSYYRIEKNEISEYSLPQNASKIIISNSQLTPKGSSTPLQISYFSFSEDQQKVLLFTNTKKVWRLNTKGDYWVLDLKSGNLTQLGKTLPESSLMFAKLSPDSKSVAYVSNNNVYAEDLATSKIKPLTTDGSVTMINGTFDWAYEEEFACRDGFRWSPDSKSIAYWQIDASSIKKFYMINNTAAIYSEVIPIEYPVVGEDPSACKVGVVTLADAKTTWMKIPGVENQNYIVRMEFIPATNNLIIQQLNRKQNNSKLYVADASNGNSKVINEESDEAWVDVFQLGNPYAIDYTNNFTWVNDNKSILWASEKDGWRHLYQIPLNGKSENLVTKGNFDIIDVKYTDAKNGYVYFLASPNNATQKYLYRTKLNGSSNAELLTPPALKGTHNYNFSSNGKYATHTFSNHFTKSASETILVENQKPLNEKESINSKLTQLQEKPTTEFFKITTKDGIEMDGWMVKPKNFDPKKKYPVVFYVYTEPAGATVADGYGASQNFLYNGDMTEDGYIYISLDNRGTPAPKGRAWRKAIYRKIGKVNIQDQAMAATEILKWNFVDPERVAVWGWSGGGSATLNLMFQYPEIYKTGIAIAACGNLLTYDNIYQERYMGLPQENMEDFVNGSPITYAKNLQGNLLYIHGTGDDNVHYQNAEMLVNELVKYNKQFQFMPYPNRTHSISEGEGTQEHLSTLYTNYLKMYCPPGGK